MSDKQKLAQVFHFDLYGKREEKYNFLNQNSIETIDWNTLEPTAPNYFFVNKNFEGIEEYEKGFNLRTLFTINSIGIATGDDDEFVSFTKSKIESKYEIATSFFYRPFDMRFTIFDNKILQRARFNVMQNYKSKNIGLNVGRQSKLKGIECLISSNISCKHFITGETYTFPLYLYPTTNAQQTTNETVERTPNLNQEIVQQIAEKIGLKFVAEKDPVGFKNLPGMQENFSPIDILDYIYAVLHSPTYREKYKEFLKIDFPRVPFPSTGLNPLETQQKFQNLVSLGAQLRALHLLESKIVNKPITKYPVDGNNMVEKIKFITGNVFINETQYFADVPETAWNFYIGGYQPAQKWLKDRKGRTLEFDDILHYQKIIVALSETDRLMKEIEKIEI